MEDKEVIIFESNGLFGAKLANGNIVIPPQYKEMYPFSFGLSLVRNTRYEYSYVDIHNTPLFAFGTYQWCDIQFVHGFARVMKYNAIEQNDKWGIIDTSGVLVLPLEYDRIWSIKEGFFDKIIVYKGEKQSSINLYEYAAKWPVLYGLSYISTYSIEEFKTVFHCSQLDVKLNKQVGRVYFTYGCNRGYVGTLDLERHHSKDIVVSIVCNKVGTIFPLLHLATDTGKKMYDTKTEIKNPTSKKVTSNTRYHRMTFWDYENERLNDYDNWDSYGYEQSYYDGWNRDDVDSGLADAFEYVDALWNSE